jgi:hypothetical protein
MFLSKDTVQLGTQQLRRRLFKLPRPPCRHDDAGLIEDNLIPYSRSRTTPAAAAATAVPASPIAVDLSAGHRCDST